LNFFPKQYIFINPGNDFSQQLRAPRADSAGDARMIN
jgi:hypothetical protein